MKIRSVTEGFQPFRVNEKQDHTGNSERDAQHEQERPKQEEVAVETTQEDVHQALERFSIDKQTLESGLTAAITGAGPGLKVVLKDGSGAVIRQLSGDEFVRLRETVAKDTKSPGKILDQKM